MFLVANNNINSPSFALIYEAKICKETKTSGHKIIVLCITLLYY